MKAYISAINNHPVFTTDNVERIVSFYQNYNDPPETLILTLCADAQEGILPKDTPVHLQLHQLKQTCMAQEKDRNLQGNRLFRQDSSEVGGKTSG